jgi:hypothetical protein
MLSPVKGACVRLAISLLFSGLTLTSWHADIKTYAVTPLNEECGLIEWVDNLRTLREIVLKLLKERGVIPNVWIRCPRAVSWYQYILINAVQ